MSLGDAVCERCGSGFGKNEEMINAEGQVWHRSCFVYVFEKKKNRFSTKCNLGYQQYIVLIIIYAKIDYIIGESKLHF